MVRVTGNPALNHEEMLGIAWDITAGGVFCFVFVGFVLYVALRSLRLAIAALATLLVGLVWTAAFAAAAVGHLNLISLSFAVLFIGLGVDFAIHLGMSYAALRRDGLDHADRHAGCGRLRRQLPRAVHAHHLHRLLRLRPHGLPRGRGARPDLGNRHADHPLPDVDVLPGAAELVAGAAAGRSPPRQPSLPRRFAAGLPPPRGGRAPDGTGRWDRCASRAAAHHLRAQRRSHARSVDRVRSGLQRHRRDQRSRVAVVRQRPRPGPRFGGRAGGAPRGRSTSSPRRSRSPTSSPTSRRRSARSSPISPSSSMHRCRRSRRAPT